MDNTGKTSSPSGKLIISKFTAAAIFGTLNTSFAVSQASLIFFSTAPTYFVMTVALFPVGGCLVSIIICSLSSDLQRLIITTFGCQLRKTTRAVGGIAG